MLEEMTQAGVVACNELKMAALKGGSRQRGAGGTQGATEPRQLVPVGDQDVPGGFWVLVVFWCLMANPGLGMHDIADVHTDMVLRHRHDRTASICFMYYSVQVATLPGSLFPLYMWITFSSDWLIYLYQSQSLLIIPLPHAVASNSQSIAL